MGVWIETTLDKVFGRCLEVTPCMGVWIETRVDLVTAQNQSVTPCMGVWIETYEAIDRQNSFKSHPVWVCGLKP